MRQISRLSLGGIWNIYKSKLKRGWSKEAAKSARGRRHKRKAVVLRRLRNGNINEVCVPTPHALILDKMRSKSTYYAQLFFTNARPTRPKNPDFLFYLGNGQLGTGLRNIVSTLNCWGCVWISNSKQRTYRDGITPETGGGSIQKKTIV